MGCGSRNRQKSECICVFGRYGALIYRCSSIGRAMGLREMAWTLNTELCKLAFVESVPMALCRLGLLDDVDEEFGLLLDEGGWQRGGAETYIFKFQVRKRAVNLNCILKACVAFHPKGIESILESWIERRHLLKSNGVSTPRLYGWGHGVLLEELIPYQMSTAVASGANSSILEELARTYGIVSRLGFAPVRLFEGLGSRGTDVVVIDVGEDLGPPEITNASGRRIFDLLLMDLTTNFCAITDARHDEMWTTFCRAANISLR